MPLYPWSPSPFEEIVAPFAFGLQLIPVPSETRPRLKNFTLGLPLESSTNAAQRQHLVALAPEVFGMTVIRPTFSLFRELASSLAGVIDTLSIRYLLIPQDHDFVDPAMFVSEALDAFKHVHLHLPARANMMSYRIHMNQVETAATFADRIVDLVLADKERQERYTVWVEDPRNGFNLDLSRREKVLYQPQPVEKDKVLFDVDFDSALDTPVESSSRSLPASSVQTSTTTATSPASKNSKGKGKDTEKVWDRETNLKLLGGLISLRLESKKR
jgi:hypothetical protein